MCLAARCEYTQSPLVADFLGYFLLGDSLNTTVTVVATLQNSVVEYSTLDLTYLLLVGIATQAIGIYSFWFVQRRYGFTSKTMFNVIAFNIVVLDGEYPRSWRLSKAPIVLGSLRTFEVSLEKNSLTLPNAQGGAW